MPPREAGTPPAVAIKRAGCYNIAVQGSLYKKNLEEQIKKMRDGVRRLSLRYTPDAVHDLRVAALRGSFALKLFQPKASGIKKIKADLKQARAVMGRARALDILSVSATKNISEMKLKPLQAKSIIRLIGSHKSAAHQDLMAMLESPRLPRLFKKLKACSKCRPLGLSSVVRGTFKDAVEKLLDFRSRRIHRGEVHQVRIAFKKLRYACEFLEKIDPPRLKKARRWMMPFQDLLGDRQDAVTSLCLLEEFDPDRSLLGPLARAEAKSAGKLERKFFKKWQKAFHKPSVALDLQRWSSHY